MEDYTDIHVLKDRLNRLRRNLRLLALLAGVATVVISIVGLCYLSLLVDWVAHMDISQRGVFLVLCLGLLAWIAAKYLLAPLKVGLDEDALCLLVEKKNPELGSNLISALQLERMESPASRGYSLAMVANAISRGGGMAQAADFDSVLNTGYRNKRLILAGITACAFLATCVFFQSTMAIWFQRNLLFMQTPWPKDTRLTVLNMKSGGLTVAEGDDLTISVKAESLRGKPLPSEVDVVYRFANGVEGAPQTVGTSGEALFRTVVKNVTESFEFKVTGGDDDTGWLPVTVMPRPALSVFTVEATPPAYTKEPPTILANGQSVYKLLAGTSLKVHGQATQSLSSLTITAPSAEQGTVLDCTGTDTFDFSIDTPAQGTYRFLMTNDRGITAKAPIEFRVRLLPDAKPTVKVSIDGVGDILLPKALLPLNVQAKDDYGIISAVLNAQVTMENESTERTTDTPLPKLVTGREPVRYVHSYDVTPLGLKPGSHLMLKASATDNDTVSGPKTATSSTLVFRIVTEEEFREALLRNEQALRLDFDQIVAKQTALLEKLRIIKNTKNGDSSQVRREQQRLNQRVRETTQAFQATFAEVVNNRLEAEDGPTVTRLRDGIIIPLQNLIEKELATVLLKLKADDLEAAQTAQAAALARMKAIRKSMVQSETFQQAAKILRNIIERQKNLKAETKKKAEEDINDVFE